MPAEDTPSQFETQRYELLYNLYISLHLCFVGNKNLLVSSDRIDDAESQIIKLLTETFDFTKEENIRTIHCDSKTSYKDLLLFIEKSKAVASASLKRSTLRRQRSNISDSDTSKLSSDSDMSSQPGIITPTILIFKNLDKTSQGFQVSLLETIRSYERTSSKCSDLTFSKGIFLVIGLVKNINGTETSLYRYLQYYFWFRQSHIYGQMPNSSKNVSNVSLAESQRSKNSILPLTLEDIYDGREKILKIAIVPEIRRYIHDILIFVRNHRMVTQGIPTRFVKDIGLMVRCIGYINGYQYITPYLVKIASRKIFPIKINLVNYDREMSLNWGSDIALTKAFVEKWDADLVLENVLSTVKPPL